MMTVNLYMAAKMIQNDLIPWVKDDAVPWIGQKINDAKQGSSSTQENKPGCNKLTKKKY